MKALRVVILEVGVDSCFKVLHRFIAFKVDVFILEASPQTLYPYIVQRTVTTVHTDFNSVFKQHVDEHVGSELASLIGIEYRRAAVFFYRLPQNIRVLSGIHRVEQAPA